VREHVLEMKPVDFADVLNRLSIAEAGKVLALMPEERAVAVCNQALLRRRGRIFGQLEPAFATRLLTNLSADQRAEILKEAGEHECYKLVPLLPAELRAEVERLLKYPDHTAGGIMTTEFVTLSPDQTVADALARVRSTGSDMEHIYACYVLAPDTKQLVGAISLRELVLADPTKQVREIMHPRPVTVQALEEERSVVEKISRYNLLAVPVLETDGRVVGFVTVDDAIDVLVEKQTETVLRMGAVEPDALDEPYLQATFGKMVRKRAGWLVILFLGEMLTATAMGYFDDEIKRAVVLALFVPLIISSGGNSGSQAASLIIRALALKEVRLRDWWRIMRREILSGLTLGAILAVIGFARIALWSAFSDLYGEHWLLVAITVAFSLIGVVMWGTLSGSMLPFVLKRLGFDPATSSAPFVATLVDVTGLVIYFTVAALILHGTLL
jgi:magnesium transporter